jgi:hypothetical protein
MKSGGVEDGISGMTASCKVCQSSKEGEVWSGKKKKPIVDGQAAVVNDFYRYIEQLLWAYGEECFFGRGWHRYPHSEFRYLVSILFHSRSIKKQ